MKKMNFSPQATGIIENKLGDVHFGFDDSGGGHQASHLVGDIDTGHDGH